jgi:hypothetical protein
MLRACALVNVSQELKKREAKLLRSQETFEVLNTGLIHDFLDAQQKRAAFMADRFKDVLKTVMLMLNSLGKNVDMIVVPMLQSATQSAARTAHSLSNAPQLLQPTLSACAAAAMALLTRGRTLAGASPTRVEETEDLDTQASRSRARIVGAELRAGGKHRKQNSSSLRFSSDHVEMLFNPGLDPETVRRQEEAIQYHLRSFNSAMGFQRLHELARPPMQQQAEARQPMDLAARGRRASRHVRPPVPPSAGVDLQQQRSQRRSMITVPVTTINEDETLAPSTLPQPPAMSAVAETVQVAGAADATAPVAEAADDERETTVKHARVLYDYEPQFEGDLGLQAGEQLLVYQWWACERRALRLPALCCTALCLCPADRASFARTRAQDGGRAPQRGLVARIRARADGLLPGVVRGAAGRDGAGERARARGDANGLRGGGPGRRRPSGAADRAPARAHDAAAAAAAGQSRQAADPAAAAAGRLRAAHGHASAGDSGRGGGGDGVAAVVHVQPDAARAAARGARAVRARARARLGPGVRSALGAPRLLLRLRLLRAIDVEEGSLQNVRALALTNHTLIFCEFIHFKYTKLVFSDALL